MAHTRTALIMSVALATSACAAMLKGPDASLKLPKDQIQAIDQMTSARCAREDICRPGTFSLLAAPGNCGEQLRVTTATDVRLSRCAGPIVNVALEQCIRDIQRTSCAVDVENITRVGACRVGFLCIPDSEEGSL